MRVLGLCPKTSLYLFFCERPSNWGDRQFTPCTTFAKDPRFLNMVMTFVLFPLSHYNSITEPRARFLLSLLEHLTIDFLSHFILSIIDVYRDMATRDKLIFPSAITRILRHFFVPFPVSDHFHVMCAIDTATIKWSEVQLHTRWSGSVAPPTPLTPSTSASFSSVGGVTLDAIMTQFQRINARLDTLSDKLCQVNTHIGRIAKRQAHLGGFMESPSSRPKASKDDEASEDNDDFDDDDDDEDGDVSSSSVDEMST